MDTNPTDLIDQGIVFYFTLMYCNQFALLEIQMNSSPPPLNHHELQGASHTIGGIFWGRAYGNQPNIADLVDQDEPLIPVIGKIYIYITSNDPATWDLTMMKHHLVMKH